MGEVIASLSGNSKDEDILSKAEHIAKGITLDTVNGVFRVSIVKLKHMLKLDHVAQRERTP